MSWRDGVGVVRPHQLEAPSFAVLAAVGEQPALGGGVVVVGGDHCGDRLA